MRCLRQIAGTRRQDVVPNTEVLDQCETCGIEFHNKRAQLRWSGLLRTTDDRIPKALFYGQLKTGCRTRCDQRKRYKVVIKSMLKSCCTPLNTWDSTATNNSPLCRIARADTTKTIQRPTNTAEEWSTSERTCDHI